LFALKPLRISRGLTQVKLGEMVGITQQSIQAIETGKSKPSFDTLIELATALDCTVDELLTEPEASA
jgi:Predicted transcriptional regulators